MTGFIKRPRRISQPILRAKVQSSGVTQTASLLLSPAVMNSSIIATPPPAIATIGRTHRLTMIRPDKFLPISLAFMGGKDQVGDKHQGYPQRRKNGDVHWFHGQDSLLFTQVEDFPTPSPSNAARRFGQTGHHAGVSDGATGKQRVQVTRIALVRTQRFCHGFHKHSIIR